MKKLLTILALGLMFVGIVAPAQADQYGRYCRKERRCGDCGMSIYHGYGFSRQSSHHGYHYHYRHTCGRSHDYDRHHHDSYRHSRSSGFRFFFR